MKESIIYSNVMIPTNNKTTGISKPGESTLNLPSALITSQLAAIIVSLFFVVASVWANQLNTPISQTFAKRVTVVSFISDKAFRGLARAASVFTWHRDIVYRSLEERDFTRGRRVQVVPQRNSLAVNHHHPLRAFPPLGFADAFAPFFAGAKLPSIKASLQSNCFFSSSSERKARHALTHMSCSSQSFSLLQQVEGLGYSLGRSCHGHPVLNTHRIPSKTLRLSAQGLPPFLFTLGLGKILSSFSHCSSVSSIRFFVLVIEDPPFNDQVYIMVSDYARV